MIQIKVPATSANIGPGFDCLGMAVNLYNRVIFEEVEEGLQIEGCDQEFKNKNNLVYTSLIRTFDEIGYRHRGIRIIMDCHIPESRGLGSSAACIVAGVMGANELAQGRLTKTEILEIATKIEGHPDNITPALFGGVTVSIYDDNRVYFSKIPVKDNFKLYALIPSFTLSTAESRAILPATIPFKDATFNVGRAVLMITSLVNGDLDLLNVSIQDKLHQDYRGRLIFEYDRIMEELNSLSIKGAFLSGAGPTIMVISEKNNNLLKNSISEILMKLKNKWILKELFIENQGAIVEVHHNERK